MAATTDFQPELPMSSSIIPTTSLFDGELYDDELIEIYNIPLGNSGTTAVIDSNELQQTTNDLPEVTAQEWTSLNISSTTMTEEVISTKNLPAVTTTTTPGSVVGLVEDDFLGTFKPSTSFDRLEAALLASGPNNSNKTTTNQIPLHSTNYMETSSRRVSVVEGVSVNTIPNKSEQAGVVGVLRGPVVEVVPNTWQANLNPSPLPAENQLNCETTGIPNPLSGICDSVVHDPPPVPITLQTTLPVVAPVAAAPQAIITPATSPAAILSQEFTSLQPTATAIPDKASSFSSVMDVSTSATATVTQHRTTEADIASSAKGAVLELIRDSSISVRGDNPSGIGEGKVDTSTARIRALTGDNWVEATRYVLPSLAKMETLDSTATISKVSNIIGDNKRQRQDHECAKQSITTQHKTTEADIASSAKGAVLNLIRSSSISSRGDNSSRLGEGEIDTSTARIRALTGDNWVEATRYDLPSLAKMETSETATTTTSKTNNNIKDNKRQRQNLTPQECAKQKARNRNREHARNTRLRKKAYVEELKRTLTQLVAQKDIEENQKGQDAQRKIDQREVRFMVIEEFLKLRGRNEPNFGCWDAILEDDFAFTLPVTRYRKMVHDKNNINQEDRDSSSSTTMSTSPPPKLEQVLTGVTEVMADAQHSASFLLESKEGNSPINPSLPPVSFAYHCDRDNMLMDGANVMLHWTASSVGAVKHEISRAELSLQGCLRAAFNPVSNKLLSIKMTFDTSLISTQLKRNFSIDLPPTKRRKIALSNPCDQITAAVASAHYAARGTDSILEYLQIMPSTAASVTSSDNSE